MVLLQRLSAQSRTVLEPVCGPGTVYRLLLERDASLPPSR
jgi:hypothetical protein